MSNDGRLNCGLFVIDLGIVENKHLALVLLQLKLSCIVVERQLILNDSTIYA